MKQQLPAELEDTRAKFQAWRQTRKNGDHLPGALWSEAAGLARRLGVNRVCRALGLNHTALKEHAAKGRVVIRPVQRPRPEPVRPAFVELDGGHVPGEHLPGRRAHGAALAGRKRRRLLRSGGRIPGERVMLQVAPQMKILLAVEPVDFRQGIDCLAQTCRERLQADPTTGAVFVFRNRARTAIKVLSHDLC